MKQQRSEFFFFLKLFLKVASYFEIIEIQTMIGRKGINPFKTIHPDHFGEINSTYTFFRKYLKGKCSSKVD